MKEIQSVHANYGPHRGFLTHLEKGSYTVEGQLYVSCVQCGGSLIGADDWSEIIKAGVHFHHEAFVLRKDRDIILEILHKPL